MTPAFTHGARVATRGAGSLREAAMLNPHMTQRLRRKVPLRWWVTLALVIATGSAWGEEPEETALSKLRFDLYGYIKIDAAFDTQRTDNGNFIRWVESRDDALGTGRTDSEFNLTANQSRVGINLTAPTYQGIETAGKLEVDLYGGDDEDEPNLRVRHAYLEIRIPEANVTILAGQTWDLHSPLLPTTVNLAPNWWAGNIGFRRAQLRLTRTIERASGARWILQGALARNIGSTFPLVNDDTGTIADSGEDRGLPTIQWRAALSVPLYQRRATFGVSGHWGEEEFDISNTGAQEDFESWSVNLDFQVPFSDRVLLRGELWTGANLASYLGGIGQGVSIPALDGGVGEEIGATGGWVQLSLKASEKLRVNYGFSLDDPHNRDLPAGARQRNRSIYGNVLYNLTPNLVIAAEVGHWKTDYKGIRNGDTVRAQVAALLKF